ncbi:hypothetical protein [Corynebacterium oculi]|uniref:hypothetical protein n=1 Tax=Corynebacterium oculi TaxID=1544416 RepID=UPI00123736E5|nr:hypothetical protein [Corynebacterium oculi]
MPQPRYRWENGERTNVQEVTPSGRPAYQVRDVLVIWEGEAEMGNLVTAISAELNGGYVYAVDPDAVVTLGARTAMNSTFAEQTITVTSDGLKPVSDLREALYGQEAA